MNLELSSQTLDEEAISRLVQERRQRDIAAMFDAIAQRYDLMNRIMTGGQDVRWRRIAADAARLSPGKKALDVATGTGDLAHELAPRVIPGGEVVGVDLAANMLVVARRKLGNYPIRFEQLDVMDLPYDSEFDAATVAFGFRNFADRRSGLESMHNALRPGGRLVVLELVRPAHPGRAGSILRLFADTYTHRVIPVLGRLIAGDAEAYTYLTRSIDAMLTPDQVTEMMRAVGLENVSVRLLNFGTVAVCAGTKSLVISH